MTDFQKRLEKAIERGYRASDIRAQAEAEKALSEQELRRLHTQYRLGAVGAHRELPGRRGAEPARVSSWSRWSRSGAGERWSAATTSKPAAAGSLAARFSRLEMVVRPVSEYFVLELAAKATIRDKEYFNRTHYQRLAEVDLASFTGLVDLWVLEFAELYAAKS